MLTDFQNSFTDGLSSKRVMKWSLKIQPHLKCVATLPCQNVNIRKLQNSETNILFNYKF